MLFEELKVFVKGLKKAVSECERTLKISPEGKFVVKNNGHRLLFYDRDKRVTDKNCIRDLAQKAYCIKVLKAAEKQLKTVEKFTKAIDADEICRIYYSLKPEVRKFITPLAVNDSDYALQWQSVKYDGLNFRKDDVIIQTDRGERVRSKSEAIIANKLYSLGIPYRYEYPIVYGDSIIYPDFTVLNKRTRKEYVFEHFGMMDNESYRKNFFAKIRLYSKLGYIPGKNLLFTMEDSNNVFDSGVFSEIIKNYLV